MQEIRMISPVQKEAKKLRIAAYCRVSSDSSDQLHSFAAQVKYYAEYIGNNPDYELVDIYADEGITGTRKDKREEFIRLIDDCQKGKIDRVVTKSVSRFARNTYDCIQTVRILKDLGISVYFEKENIDSANSPGEMTLSLHSIMAQEESMSISGNMRWSYRKRMEKGEFNCCRAAYGYTLADGELKINEQEAEIVRRIFDMYLSGMGKQHIANNLNAMSVNKRYGKDKWYTDTIDYILNNERYIGDSLLQKNYTTDTLPFRKIRNKGEKQQYYVENSHPPIISKEKFYAVKKLQNLKKKDCIPKSIYPLTKILICPDCGHYFRRKLVREKAIWTCGYNAAGRSNCKSLQFAENDVYNAFIRMVNKLIEYRKNLILPLIEQLELMQMKSSGMQNKIYLIDKEIAELNAHNLVIARLHTKGILDDTDYSAQSTDVNQKVNKLRSDRRKLLKEDENDDMLVDLKALDDTISNTNKQTEFNKNLFEDIVDSIAVISDTEIHFKLIGGLQLPEKIQRIRRC